MLEAKRLHWAARVTHYTAHDPYIDAVAATVRAAVIAVEDIDSDPGEPRGACRGTRGR